MTQIICQLYSILNQNNFFLSNLSLSTELDVRVLCCLSRAGNTTHVHLTLCSNLTFPKCSVGFSPRAVVVNRQGRYYLSLKPANEWKYFSLHRNQPYDNETANSYGSFTLHENEIYNYIGSDNEKYGFHSNMQKSFTLQRE